ncbi:MAG: hypothetical protein FWH01_18065, partial [Oscillospiraceae bacterium]|nr:hypothetical protein [Oscillospiraceae bacterium]
RLGLKIPWEQSRAGSSPASGILLAGEKDIIPARHGHIAPNPFFKRRSGTIYIVLNKNNKHHNIMIYKGRMCRH